MYNPSLISDYIYLFTAFITSSSDNIGPCKKKSPLNLARKIRLQPKIEIIYRHVPGDNVIKTVYETVVQISF
jgi:hypothetical protein